MPRRNNSQSVQVRSGDIQAYNECIEHETLRVAVCGMMENPTCGESTFPLNACSALLMTPSYTRIQRSDGRLLSRSLRFLRGKGGAAEGQGWQANEGTCLRVVHSTHADGRIPSERGEATSGTRRCFLDWLPSKNVSRSKRRQ